MRQATFVSQSRFTAEGGFVSTVFLDVELAWNWRTGRKEELAIWKIEQLMEQYCN